MDGFHMCCAVPCCAVLCRAVPCCAVLCCAVLCCAVPCCAVLCRAVLCCAVLCRAVPCRAVPACCVIFKDTMADGINLHGYVCAGNQLGAKRQIGTLCAAAVYAELRLGASYML